MRQTEPCIIGNRAMLSGHGGVTAHASLAGVTPLCLALLVFVWPADSAIAQSGVSDCTPVLAKDNYSYAETQHIETDFLKSIDQSAWQELKKGDTASLSGTVIVGALFGWFNLQNSYQEFDSSRSQYLESVHYHRTVNDARTIVTTVTNPRAYPAYEACLRALSNTQQPLRVWAASATMEELELRVRYQNPTNVDHVDLEGTIEGGTVSGAPAGRLWRGRKRWRVNQEFGFTVHRSPGTSRTVVVVTPTNGTPPLQAEFLRADGTITLDYPGDTVAFRQHLQTSIGTKDNDNRDKDDHWCQAAIASHDGKHCTSRNPVTLTAASPLLLRNPTDHCSGNGCPWTAASSPVVSDAEHSVTAYIDNWGPKVDFILEADEYQRIDEAYCHDDGPIPVVAGVPLVLTSSSDCLPLATLRWHDLRTGAEGVMRFTVDHSADGSLQLSGQRVTAGGLVQAAFQLSK